MTEPADSRLLATVRRAMPGADADTVAIVAACAGLFACVAYADREFSEDELAHAGRLLSTVQGIGSEGSQAVVQVLEAHVVELSSVHAVRFARTLKELGHEDLRLHVLGMLLELAAANHEISQAEVNTLRQVTQSLGLSQADYNRLQQAHRDKLNTLRSRAR